MSVFNEALNYAMSEGMSTCFLQNRHFSVHANPTTSLIRDEPHSVTFRAIDDDGRHAASAPVIDGHGRDVVLAAQVLRRQQAFKLFLDFPRLAQVICLQNEFLSITYSKCVEMTNKSPMIALSVSAILPRWHFAIGN
jgi:hypothetical protein